MEHYLTNMQLSIIDNLFIDKNKELTSLVGNLQITDVKEDQPFLVNTKRIKNQILLTPVTFEEPKITTHYQTTREVPPNYQQMWGGTQNINIVTVEFCFEGSEELFEYMPNGVGLTMGRFYQPSGNRVIVEVTVTTLDKAAVIAAAKEKMSATFDLINANNAQAKQWTASKEPVIDTLMAQKRKELNDFYS
jgi:hypothetical protein